MNKHVVNIASIVVPFAAAVWLYNDTMDRRATVTPVDASISVEDAFCDGEENVILKSNDAVYEIEC